MSLCCFCGHYDSNKTRGDATRLFRAVAVRADGITLMWRDLEEQYRPRDFLTVSRDCQSLSHDNTSGSNLHRGRGFISCENHFPVQKVTKLGTPSPSSLTPVNPSVFPNNKLFLQSLELQLNGDWELYQRATATQQKRFCTAILKDIATHIRVKPDDVTVRAVSSSAARGICCSLVIKSAAVPPALKLSLSRMIASGCFVRQAAEGLCIAAVWVGVHVVLSPSPSLGKNVRRRIGALRLTLLAPFHTWKRGTFNHRRLLAAMTLRNWRKNPPHHKCREETLFLFYGFSFPFFSFLSRYQL